jgi:CRISPR/Cas system type I-B associated protein Csh2 (Cas7 group RAMP superfamily)
LPFLLFGLSAKLDHFESEGLAQNSDDKSPKEDVIKPSEIDEQKLKLDLRKTLSDMQPTKLWKWEEPKEDEFVEFAARKIKNLKAHLNAAEWRDIKWQGAHLSVAQLMITRPFLGVHI